jgi:hypothetical protein
MEKQLQFDLGTEPTGNKVEAIRNLTEALVYRDKEITRLRDLIEEQNKVIYTQGEELAAYKSKNHHTQESEESIKYRHIHTYLSYELDYAECKVQELRHHLADYPEDGYSCTDLQNCLLHINYLKAMIRRLEHHL